MPLDRAQCTHLAAPWSELTRYRNGEVMLELKMAGNHLDLKEVERALLRRPWWAGLRDLGLGRALAGAAAFAAALALAIWLQQRPQPLSADLEQVAETRDPETWELLRSEDVELLEVLEILEAWDGVQES